MRGLSTLLTLTVPLILLLAIGGATAAANPHESAQIQWTDVEPGIQYGAYSHAGVKDKILPVHVHLVKADLSQPDLTLRSLRPLGRSLKIEQIVELFRKGGVDVRAAVNGDYFSFIEREKDPLGFHVSGGQLLWFPAATSSLLVDDSNRLHMGKYELTVTVKGEKLTVPVAGANRLARKEENILYSGYYREKTIPQPGCGGMLFERDKLEPMVNGEIEVVVKKVFPARNPVKLAPLELCLVVCDPQRETTQTIEPGAKFKIAAKVKGFDPLVVEAISGGPRILREGQVVEESAQEGFSLALRFYIPRCHPRSAVGISQDGRTAYLLVGEGRLKRSEGLTAEDAAVILKAAGAHEAMLFDGGGSAVLMGPDGFYNIPHHGRSFTMRDLANTLAVIRRKKQ
jgi:hypothetical protein